jgi:hypothetical protein
MIKRSHYLTLCWYAGHAECDRFLLLCFSAIYFKCFELFDGFYTQLGDNRAEQG